MQHNGLAEDEEANCHVLLAAVQSGDAEGVSHYSKQLEVTPNHKTISLEVFKASSQTTYHPLTNTPFNQEPRYATPRHPSLSLQQNRACCGNALDFPSLHV